MLTTVTRRYHFEAAHWLPNVPDGHRCKRMHGHNYEIEVTAGGTIGNDGFIVDFWDMDKLIGPLVALIDHRCLNDQVGLENPTAENIGAWFMDRLTSERRNWDVVGVKVFETKDCWANVVR